MESTNKVQKSYPQRVAKEESAPETIKIVSLIDAKISITGRFSGRKYLFDAAGSVQDVEKKDIEWMLGLYQGERQCCGGGAGNKMFDLG